MDKIIYALSQRSRVCVDMVFSFDNKIYTNVFFM
jgi:hypothetical protein